jgi:3-oxoacyl-[acyl-carrier-protein] synthase II
MRAAIRGIGVVGGFGSGIKKLEYALVCGQRTLKLTRLSINKQSIEIPAYLSDTSALETFIHKKNLRRVDHFSRLAALGAFLSLEDAGMLQAGHGNFAVIIATGYGASNTTFSFLDSAFADGDSCASPTLFSNSVHNAAAAHVSILLKATGPNLTVSQFEMSVPSALLAARQWLEDKSLDAVLLGGVDEYCDVLAYCWQRFFGSGPATGMKPLEWNRQSAVIGEGAAFFVLTRDEGDKPKYGYITDIQMGHIRKYQSPKSENAFLFLGADGQKSSGKYYARYIAPGTRCAVYTPLYGSFPVGLSFDMATAALSIRENALFATPKHAGKGSGLKIFGKKRHLGHERIHCLRLSCDGEFAMVTLAGT